MTTHEQFVYYNFEATLKALKSFTLNNNKMKTNMTVITIFGWFNTSSSSFKEFDTVCGILFGIKNLSKKAALEGIW